MSNWFHEAVKCTPEEASWLKTKAKFTVAETDKLIAEEGLTPSEAVIRVVKNLLEKRRKKSD